MKLSRKLLLGSYTKDYLEKGSDLFDAISTVSDELPQLLKHLIIGVFVFDRRAREISVICLTEKDEFLKYQFVCPASGDECDYWCTEKVDEKWVEKFSDYYFPYRLEIDGEKLDYETILTLKEI